MLRANIQDYIHEIDTLKDLPLISAREGLLRLSLAGGVLELCMVNNYLRYRFQKELSAKPIYADSLNRLNLMTPVGAHKIDDIQSPGKYLYVFDNMIFVRSECPLKDIRDWDAYARKASKLAIQIMESDDEELISYMLMDYESALIK